MSKLNPRIKPTSKFTDERLAGGDGALAAKRVPKPFGKHNYICDVSSERHGVNYKGVWDAEISGFSENFLLFIAAYEGIENVFEEQ